LATDRVERRLAAIMATDIVGYSSLIEKDEARTLAAIRTLRTEVINPLLEAHRGRVAKLMGDGAIVEFGSVVDAVACAVALQQAVTANQAEIPPDQRIVFRVGINLGDVVVEGEDLLGDGVNIAARVEALAEPGGICITDSVMRQLAGKTDFSFEDAGEPTLKNISQPVRVYRLRSQVPSAVQGGQSSPAQPALPDRASIAVLPFANMSSDPEQEYFADGIVEDIITALSRFRTFAVVARNSTFAFKGRAIDVRTVARDLGVRYVLEVSVRRSGGKVRVNAELIEGAKGAHLWAQKFEGVLADIFAIQDEITISVIGLIEPQIRRAEIERARRKPPESIDAWDLYVQALPLVYAANVSAYSDAIGLLNRALALAPNYAPALALASWAHERRKSYGGLAPTGVDDVATSLTLAQRALDADPDDALAMALLGWERILFREDYSGLALCSRAVELNPNNRAVLDLAAVAHMFAGDLDEVIVCGMRALRLSPGASDSYACLEHIASAHFFAGRFEEAAEWAQRSIDLEKGFAFSRLFLAASDAHLDRIEKAQATMKVARTLRPDLTLAEVENYPWRFPERRKLWIDGLRMAGMFEG
jgi:adenylate cyclase